MHALSSCSKNISGNEEGYGEKRTCIRCSKNPNAAKLIEAQAFENWGNQVVKHTRKTQTTKGRYLQESYPPDSFGLRDELKRIPILKSGDNRELKAIKDKRILVDITNTCSFDAIFQLVITVAVDSEAFFLKSIVEQSSHNSFLKMIHETRKNGIQKATYRQRYNVLKEHFGDRLTGHSELSAYIMDCRSTVAEMCKGVFGREATLLERTSCSSCLKLKICRTAVVSIPHQLFVTTSRGWKEVEDYLNIGKQNKNCTTEGCSGCSVTDVVVPGNFIFFEVYSGHTQQEQITLDSIPKTAQLSVMPEPLQLRGIIHFDPPSHVPDLPFNHPEKERIGHYTCIIFRNNKWKQVEKKKIEKKTTTKVFPNLIMYTK